MHLLRSECGRFERNNQFAFVYYNIIQKQMVASNVHFSVPRSLQARLTRDLLDIDIDVLEDLMGKCWKDPFYELSDEKKKSILNILASVNVVTRHVPGSDGYKLCQHNEIWALMNTKGTPTLFITLNPSDVDNPIVHLFSGEAIVLEDVGRGKDLDGWQRRLVSKEPGCVRIVL